MALVNQLPLAPNQYSADEERAFRAVIADEIGERLGRYEVPVYGGQPGTALKGTAPAFAVPIGAGFTVLPFNTLVYDTDIGTQHVGNTIQALIKMFESISFSVHHPAGATSTNQIIVGIFINNVMVASNAATYQVANQFDIDFLNFGSLNVTDVVDIRLNHDDNVPMIFDLTKSQFVIVRMTPDPRLVGEERF